MDSKSRKITIIGVLTALCLISVALVRVPIVMFLKYEPKDVIITIGGLIFGPAVSFLTSFLSSFLEMFILSDTGVLGFIMNVLASVCFACPAVIIYRKGRSMKSAILGLLTGAIIMTVVMLLWNYIITPIFLKVPREEVVKLLVPAILPFNMIKSGLNAGFILLLYNPVVTALRKRNLVDPSSSTKEEKQRLINLSTLVIASIVIASSVLLVMVLRNMI